VTDAPANSTPARRPAPWLGLLLAVALAACAAPRPRLPLGWSSIPAGGDSACADGRPYRFFVRQGDPSRLMIYFQAGGACWDAATCSPDSLAYDKSIDNNEFADYAGIFDFADPRNPVRDFSVVFLPACTGDVFTGSSDVVYTDALGRQQRVRHRGCLDARLALDWTYRAFPQPRQVLLAGSSAGALGSIFHSQAIMSHYGASQIVQHGDGYVGVMPEGWDGPERWGMRDNLPSALQSELADVPSSRMATALYATTARAFPQHLFSQFTTGADAFQIGYYNVAAGDIRDWHTLARQDLAQLGALPNFASYVAAGFQHTILASNRFYTTHVGGVLFRDWFASLVNGRLPQSAQCAQGAADCP
jgi:hypothetical protein